MTDKTQITNSGATSFTPLCVDLDGTLVYTDVLVESIFALLKISPLYFFLLPVWLIRGKAYFKQQITDRVVLDVETLPYNNLLLEYLRKQKQQGRSLILTTACNVKHAEQVALHLEIFDKVLASDEDINLSGRRKSQRLVDEFGERGFDYVGNAKVDLEIWSHAREGILVNPEPGVSKRARNLVNVKDFNDNHGPDLRTYLQALRLHHWLKNLLVFVPLVMAHQVHDPMLLLQAVLAFLSFSLCASSVYLLNDLLDLPEDRKHPTKRNRAFACGAISIKYGVWLIPVLLLASIAIALLLPEIFLYTLIFYYAVTLAYSLKLKQILLLDVLVLSGLYTMRLIAGAAAVSVLPSFWLLAFSMFLFLSLAFVKRYSEIIVLQAEGHCSEYKRGYRAVDLETLAQFGSASGYLSVLVLALYIESEQVKLLYTNPQTIWLLCPVLLYWVSRVWLLTRRGQMHEDPVVFALKDRHSHWLGLIMFLILWVSV